MPAFYCILLSKHSLFIKLSSCHAIIRLTNVTQVSLTGTPGHILVNRYTRIKPYFPIMVCFETDEEDYNHTFYGEECYIEAIMFHISGVFWTEKSPIRVNPISI